MELKRKKNDWETGGKRDKWQGGKNEAEINERVMEIKEQR
jgi:hypothetical protein